MRVAVIDLGTNSFRLLIAEISDNQHFTIIFKENRLVKLAENGIERIGDVPFVRALSAMIYFSEKIKEHGVKKVKAIGTAAMRTASNGAALIALIKEKAEIEVELIAGGEEARLIYEGVKWAYPLSKTTEMMMDIGGGSVEFIICNEAGILWKQSFPIGMAVLKKNFHHQEPITEEEVNQIYQFLDNQLVPLFSALKKYPVTTIIGASGTFDLLQKIYVTPQTTALHAFVRVEQAEDFYQFFKSKTLEERKSLPNIPEDRVEMGVVAMVLISYVIARCGIERIAISAYSMKEGILKEMQK